jgi:excisionase family DNA binding protein
LEGPTPVPREPLLSTPQLAERLGVTRRMIERLVEQRRIPYVKVGRWTRFEPEVIDQWVASQRVIERDDDVTIALARYRKRIGR